MNQGQATVEYLGLILAGLVVACLLVRAATPVEQLALAVVHSIVPAHHRAHPSWHPAKHRRRHHSHKPPCTCIIGSTWRDSGRLTHQSLPVPPVTGGLTE